MLLCLKLAGKSVSVTDDQSLDENDFDLHPNCRRYRI